MTNELDTQLLDACRQGHYRVVQESLKQGANPNVRFANGTPAIYFAAWSGRQTAVKHLINRGADVNASDAEGWTALHIASARDHSDAVTQLLAAGANATSTDMLGNTPLHAACQTGAAEAAKVLLDHGELDVNAENRHGDTPLILAQRSQHARTIALIEHHQLQHAYCSNNYTDTEPAVRL